MVALAVAGWLSVLPQVGGIALLAVWLAWLLLLLWLVWKTIDWFVDYRVVTSDRILIISGILARDIAMIPYAQLTDMSFRRSQIGLLLGFGTLVLYLDDPLISVWEIDLVPYPEQFYLELFSIVDRYQSPPDD